MSKKSQDILRWNKSPTKESFKKLVENVLLMAGKHYCSISLRYNNLSIYIAHTFIKTPNIGAKEKYKLSMKLNISKGKQVNK